MKKMAKQLIELAKIKFDKDLKGKDKNNPIMLDVFEKEYTEIRDVADVMSTGTIDDVTGLFWRLDAVVRDNIGNMLLEIDEAFYLREFGPGLILLPKYVETHETFTGVEPGPTHVSKR